MESNMAGPTFNPNSLSLTTSIPMSPGHIRTVYPEDVRAEVEKLKRDIMEHLGIEDLYGFCLYPNIRLPEGFKLPKMEMFDGLGDPKTHLVMYIRMLKPIGLRDEHLVQLFHRSLKGPALRWFSQLKSSEIETFDDVMRLFIKQYQLNTLLSDTTRELQMMKQGPNEGFGMFMKRWNNKLAQVVNHPTEWDQLRMIKKSLQPRYFKLLFMTTSLRDLIHAGREVEEAFHEGILRKDEHGSSSKKRKSTDDGGVNMIDPTKQKLRPKQRKFASWGKPMFEVMKDLVQQGHLKPLEPSPLPHPRPRTYKPEQYCSFHQGPGHFTNNCIRLRHEVQNLVDAEVVAPPAKRRRLDP